MGQIPIKGQKGQFRGSSTHWQNLTSPNAFHWLIPSREDTLDDKEAQGMKQFILILLSEEAQRFDILGHLHLCFAPLQIASAVVTAVTTAVPFHLLLR
ncbi:hypothetical protein Tco_0711038 [Tanacetum coccineum]